MEVVAEPEDEIQLLAVSPAQAEALGRITAPDSSVLTE